MNNLIINFKNTDNILDDSVYIIESSKDNAYKAINISLIQRNWLLGYRIWLEVYKEFF